jgi:hypothetical protein
VPFNRLVTLHWGAMGLSDAEAGRAIGRVLKLWREALAWFGEHEDGAPTVEATSGS